MIDSQITRFDIEPRNWPPDLTKVPGVYELIALTARGLPKPLVRVGGVDKKGTLYLGQVKDLRARLISIRRMLFSSEDTRGPMPAMTYKASKPIRALVPPAQVAFRFRTCLNQRKEEMRLLKKYFDVYGEVPPLNGRAEFITK